MAVSIDSPKYFVGTGPISFSQLQSTFGDATPDKTDVKFSDYLRDTSDNENPIVPDSTENADISATKENLSLETFRDSNKHYHVTFTGTAAQKEFQAHFNNNLTKNIPKKLNIGTEDGNTEGKLVSGNAATYAATLTSSGNIRNMDMNVNAQGAVYGAAGSIDGSTKSVSGTVTITDTSGEILISNNSGISIIVERYNDLPAGSEGTEGHPVGDIGYFITFSQINNPSVSLNVLDTATRASGLTASDNSIAVSSGYPQTISGTKFKAAFDMTNSQGPGLQSTYVRSWSFTFSGTVDTGGAGGGALYLNTGNASRNFNFAIKDGGKVWGGGGGGHPGQGAPSKSVSCNFVAVNFSIRNASVPAVWKWQPGYTVPHVVNAGNGRGCGRKFRGTGIPGPGPGYNTSGGPLRGWASTTGRRGGGTCQKTWWQHYSGYSYSVPQPNRSKVVQNNSPQPSRTLYTPAGIGGIGGPGQGWTGDAGGSIQNASAGNPGYGGGTVNCSSLRYNYPPGSTTSSMQSKAGKRVSFSGGSAVTGSGGKGGDGGTWGQTAGGAGGDAIKHNGSIFFSGTGNSTKLKGRFSN